MLKTLVVGIILLAQTSVPLQPRPSFTWTNAGPAGDSTGVYLAQDGTVIFVSDGTATRTNIKCDQPTPADGFKHCKATPIPKCH